MAFNPFDSKLIFILLTLMISLTFLLLNKKLLPKPTQNNIHQPRHESSFRQNLKWYDVLVKESQRKKIKIGLANMDGELVDEINNQLDGLAETITIHFDPIDNHKDRKWSDFFPERIDEDHEKGILPSCPEIPMPEFEDYRRLDVVVARVPCESGVKDVFRLQINLVVANMLVRTTTRWMNHGYQLDRTVYAVFIGSCGPMHEIFRCDDLLIRGDDFLVYKPHLKKLKQKVLMPVGTCQLAPPHEEPGEEMRRTCELSRTKEDTLLKPRDAYVTVLHSSDAYVCGAIALAHSIIQTNTTKDLVLLADDSITKNSLRGLAAAGWKIKHIDRIRSPHAKRKIYSEWNYSKLRIWQLTEYDKIMYIDADLIVLENIDEFFVYPQLSAVGDVDSVFNSGVMLIEPSTCTFETLIGNMFDVDSYDEADQGFLNEMFVWWHRWPSRLNCLKLFDGVDDVDRNREMPRNPFAIHYMGLKPWMCLEAEYDCNWEMSGLHRFASDSAHRRWLKLYGDLPERLKSCCEITIREDPKLARIRKWRESYKDGTGLIHGYWKIYSLIILSITFVLWRKKIESAIVHVSSLACCYYVNKRN